MKGATNREVPSALAMATLLGASPPKTTCKNVLVTKATAKAMASVKPPGTARATNRGSRRCLNAGSPIHPKPSEEIVIPSWHTERYESSLSVAFLRSPDERLPSRTSPSPCVERIFTIPNSAATNRPFRATRNKARTTRRPSSTRPLKPMPSKEEPRAPRGGRRRREGTRWFADIHAAPQAYHAGPDAVIHPTSYDMFSQKFVYLILHSRRLILPRASL